MLSCKEKLNKKNKVGAAFTDDGFVMGKICSAVITAKHSLVLDKMSSLSRVPELKIDFFATLDIKQYHMKVLLSSFHLNGRTLGFHPQT